MERTPYNHIRRRADGREKRRYIYDWRTGMAHSIDANGKKTPGMNAITKRDKALVASMDAWAKGSGRGNW